MNDLSLFDASPTQREVDKSTRGRVRRTDPETSKAAAQSIGRGAEDAIRRLFAIPRSLCDDELQALLPEWHGPTVVTARSRLHRDGWLVDSGERRKSKRNRDQIVWIRDLSEEREK